ncbi:MAG: hypothetical protein F4Y04_05765 [Chloroflexi bacterium]|nr:hypothetical protein [Chloroflexota bacterium]
MTGGEYSYQWFRNGEAIQGDTHTELIEGDGILLAVNVGPQGQFYTITDTDAGEVLSVRVQE